MRGSASRSPPTGPDRLPPGRSSSDQATGLRGRAHGRPRAATARVDATVVEELGSATHVLFTIDAPPVDADSVRAATDDGERATLLATDRRPSSRRRSRRSRRAPANAGSRSIPPSFTSRPGDGREPRSSSDVAAALSSGTMRAEFDHRCPELSRRALGRTRRPTPASGAGTGHDRRRQSQPRLGGVARRGRFPSG